MEFIERLTTLDGAKVLLFFAVWIASREWERARWRLGVKSDAPFAVGRRTYFAKEITKEDLDAEEPK